MNKNTKEKLKEIYIVSTDRYGECELVFDEELNCLDGWSMNDGNWRNEYFGGFMKKTKISKRYFVQLVQNI